MEKITIKRTVPFDMPFKSQEFTGMVRCKVLGIYKGNRVLIRYWHNGKPQEWSESFYPLSDFIAKWPNHHVEIID